MLWWPLADKYKSGYFCHNVSQLSELFPESTIVKLHVWYFVQDK